MAEKLTFNQVEEQSKEGSDTEPTMLLRRSRGEIQTARLTPQMDEHGRYYAAFTDIENGVPVNKLKPLSRESLSDQYQAGLADELAATLVHDETEPLEATPEHESHIPQEIIHEAGEAALELVGIEEPLPAIRHESEVEDDAAEKDNAKIDTDLLQSARVEYKVQTSAIIEDMKDEVGAMLGRMSRDLEEADGQVRIAQQALAEESHRLTLLMRRVEDGDIHLAQVTRHIEEIQQTLHGMRGRLQNASEIPSGIARGARAEAVGGSLTTAAGVLDNRDKGFHDFVRDQNGGVTPPEVTQLTTDEVRADIRRVQDLVDEAMPGVARANLPFEEADMRLSHVLRGLEEVIASRGNSSTEGLYRVVSSLRSIDLSGARLGGAAELIDAARRKLQSIESTQ